jgi:hypothetical protein
MTPLQPRPAAEAGKSAASYPGKRIAAETGPGGMFAPSRAGALRTRGTIRPLVLLIDFADVDPRFHADRTAHPKEYYEELFFAGADKSVRTYLRENSFGALEVAGDVGDWLLSGQSYANYYVNRDHQIGTADDHGFDLTPGAFNPALDPYPKNVWGMVMEAVALADPTVDFSQYDGDGNGVVDALIVVHAGFGGEQSQAFPLTHAPPFGEEAHDRKLMGLGIFQAVGVRRPRFDQTDQEAILDAQGLGLCLAENSNILEVLKKYAEKLITNIKQYTLSSA